MSMTNSAIYNSMTELQAINYVFATNSLQIFTLNGITDEYFTTYKDHYKFIVDFYHKYQQLPSRESFQGKFANDFEWINVSDPEEYIVSKLKEAKLYRDIIVSYKQIGEYIKAEQSDKAVEKMAAIAQQFMKTQQSKCIDLISDAQIRYDNYIERVNNPSKSFVTTGLKELDEVLGGWDMLNETAIIAARTGIGKSWFLTYFALQAAREGLRVGYYSGEMETDLIGYRLDTFCGNIANGSLTHGNENVRDNYSNYISSLNKVIKGHIFCITPDMLDGKVTVSKLRAFIEKYDLQMLCVDQFSLVDDERNARTPREQAVNISKDLRTLQRIKKIPILTAVQLNREDTSDNGPSNRNIAESDRIGQDATTIIIVDKKGDNVRLTIDKARNAKTGDKLTYAWNINMGILHYIPTENDARKGAGSDILIEQYEDSKRSDSVF